MGNNNTMLGMNFEEFLRGKFNSRSNQIPKNLADVIRDPNLPEEMKMLYGGTLKHRIDVLDAATSGIMLCSAEESFSMPITEAQEHQIEEYTKRFYEKIGYRFNKKDTCGLSDTYFFRNDAGEALVATYTLPMHNDKEDLLVSISKIRVH